MHAVTMRFLAVTYVTIAYMTMIYVIVTIFHRYPGLTRYSVAGLCWLWGQRRSAALCIMEQRRRMEYGVISGWAVCLSLMVRWPCKSPTISLVSQLLFI